MQKERKKNDENEHIVRYISCDSLKRTITTRNLSQLINNKNSQLNAE